MRHVLVLGAGLTGLSTAHHLQRRGIDSLVIEREVEAGGACRTLEAGDFSFDLTGHLLHLGQDESRQLVAELGLASRLRRHARRSGVLVAGTVVPYPVQIHIARLPGPLRRECLLGALAAREHPEAPEAGAFADWALSRFGPGLCRVFFFPYNEKLFCAPAHDFTAAWVGRFVPRPQLEDLVDGALGTFRRPVGYNATFLYPRQGGIRLLADALARTLPALRRGCPVTRLHLRERALELATGEVIAWSHLVATAALPHLAALCEDLPAASRTAAGTLRAVAVLNLNLGVEGPPPRREHWLYVPEPRYPFYRVGIPSNHGRLAPRGCHTLSVEVSVPAGAAAPPGLWERCLDGLEELGLVHRERIVARAEARIDPAYVVFDRAREAAVAALREVFAAAGVRLAGRWAEWKYSSMEDALLDGAAAAAEVAP